MNYRKETECLKVDINEASLLLKASKIEPFSKLIEIIKNIIKRIDESIWNFSLPIKELEEFSTLLLLRVTTRIDKIRCSEFVTIAQEIFERIKDMPFSETVTTGILEFLGDSELLFYEEQMKKEIDCLYVRVNTLREKLNNFQLKKARNNQQDLIEESVIKEEAAETVSKQETQTNIQNVEGVEPEGLIHENTISQLSSPKPKEFIFENTFTEISSPKSIKNSEHARSFLDLNSTPRVIPEKKDHSFCLLDIYGNFVMIDKMAEILFETKHSDLIESNLFDLMIPFSLIYLKKIMGESLFSSLGSQSKIFSYTIYSKRAARRYQKLISSMDKKEENERRKIFESQKFSAEEKALINVDNGVYYKHLQTLTSRATLIELKFSKISDLSNLENTQNLKIRLEHELFKEIKEEGVVSQPAILLLTRKASHIQRFKYSLMEKYDENIIDMNKKFENKLSKVKKMSKKEAGFQDKVEFNYTPPHNQRTYYDLSSPYN